MSDKLYLNRRDYGIRVRDFGTIALVADIPLPYLQRPWAHPRCVSRRRTKEGAHGLHRHFGWPAGHRIAYELLDRVRDYSKPKLDDFCHGDSHGADRRFL